MAGQSRHVWEHSIPPVDAKRYSVTFRTMAGEVNRALRPSVPSVPGGRLLEFVPPAGIDRPWTLMLLVTPSSEPLCIRLLILQTERKRDPPGSFWYVRRRPAGGVQPTRCGRVVVVAVPRDAWPLSDRSYGMA